MTGGGGWMPGDDEAARREIDEMMFGNARRADRLAMAFAKGYLLVGLVLAVLTAIFILVVSQIGPYEPDDVPPPDPNAPIFPLYDPSMDEP